MSRPSTLRRVRAFSAKGKTQKADRSLGCGFQPENKPVGHHEGARERAQLNPAARGVFVFIKLNQSY